MILNLGIKCERFAWIDNIFRFAHIQWTVKFWTKHLEFGSRRSWNTGMLFRLWGNYCVLLPKLIKTILFQLQPIKRQRNNRHRWVVRRPQQLLAQHQPINNWTPRTRNPTMMLMKPLTKTMMMNVWIDQLTAINRCIPNEIRKRERYSHAHKSFNWSPRSMWKSKSVKLSRSVGDLDN